MSDSVVIREFGYSFPWHWGWVVCSGLLVSIAVLQLYIRERGESRFGSRLALAAIRIMLCWLSLLGLMNWHVVTKKFQRAELLICFDSSASLQHLDRLPPGNEIGPLNRDFETGKPSRLNVLKTKLGKVGDRWLTDLQRDFSPAAFKIGKAIRSFEFGSMSELLKQLEANDSESLIDDNLDQILRRAKQVQPAAVLVFTDGLDSKDRGFVKTIRSAQSTGIPFYPVGLGASQPADDLHLVKLDANRRVFLSDLVEFHLTIAADGFAGKKTRIQLIDQQDEEIIAEREVTVPVDHYRDLVSFRVRMLKPGKRELIARIFPLEEEFDKENNSKSILVDVDSEKIKVLLAANYPSREFHFLKQFLGREAKQDPDLPTEFATNRIELHTLLQQADVEYAAIDRHAIKIFPVTRKQLFAYDVVILCDLKPNWAGDFSGGLGNSELNHLREFVEERGGGLVVVAGPRYMPQSYVNSPLADLLPLKIKELQTPEAVGVDAKSLNRPYRIRKTLFGTKFLPLELGSQAEPKSLSELEGTYWFASSFSAKPSSVVLAEIYDSQTAFPAIMMQRAGNGTVLYQAFPETYRWRFRTSEIYFGRYWSQMIQFLASTKLVKGSQKWLLETDRTEYFRDEPVQVFGNLLDKSVLKELSLPGTLRNRSGYDRQIKLNRTDDNLDVFSVTLTDLGPGYYELFLADDQQVRTEFEVIDSKRENQRQPINEGNLRRLAEKTGGRFFKIDELENLITTLPKQPLVATGEEPPWVFWKQWEWASLFAGIFLLLISVEWILRKRCSML